MKTYMIWPRLVTGYLNVQNSFFPNFLQVTLPNFFLSHLVYLLILHKVNLGIVIAGRELFFH